MASAEEIRKWAVGEPRPTADPSTGDIRAALFFRLPEQPSNIEGSDYLRCVGEQRVIVETEIAAQLAELNAILRDLAEKLQECLLMR